jgi:hypothetical protein
MKSGQVILDFSKIDGAKTICHSKTISRPEI